MFTFMCHIVNIQFMTDPVYLIDSIFTHAIINASFLSAFVQTFQQCFPGPSRTAKIPNSRVFYDSNAVFSTTFQSQYCVYIINCNTVGKSNKESLPNQYSAL